MSFPDWQGNAIRSRGSAMPQRSGVEKPAMRNTCNLHVRFFWRMQRASRARAAEAEHPHLSMQVVLCDCMRLM